VLPSGLTSSETLPVQALRPLLLPRLQAGMGAMTARRARRGIGVALVGLGLGLASWAMPAQARTPDSPLAVPPVALQTLPPEARHTHGLILKGGPFPYRKDGTVFFNRERLLPLHPRGHYREYTVRTPGAPNRGARRIVCGGTPPTAPEACYYTADHYNSFRRIAP
jgi:ribonuclease T1